MILTGKTVWSFGGMILTGENRVWSIGGIILTGENPKYWERNFPHCHLLHNNFRRDVPGIELLLPRQEAGHLATKPRHGSVA
jgi:hypothetical protein